MTPQYGQSREQAQEIEVIFFACQTIVDRLCSPPLWAGTGVGHKLYISFLVWPGRYYHPIGALNRDPNACFRYIRSPVKLTPPGWHARLEGASGVSVTGGPG